MSTIGLKVQITRPNDKCKKSKERRPWEIVVVIGYCLYNVLITDLLSQYLKNCRNFNFQKAELHFYSQQNFAFEILFL